LRRVRGGRGGLGLAGRRGGGDDRRIFDLNLLSTGTIDSQNELMNSIISIFTDINKMLGLSKNQRHSVILAAPKKGLQVLVLHWRGLL
jgi:hypothetical protein